MKFAISLLLVLSSLSALGSPIQIYYESDPLKAEEVKNIFTNSYKIPDELIELSETMKCDELRGRGKLNLCINNNGDLIVVSVDRGFISESLKIFRAP